MSSWTSQQHLIIFLDPRSSFGFPDTASASFLPLPGPSEASLWPAPGIHPWQQPLVQFHCHRCLITAMDFRPSDTPNSTCSRSKATTFTPAPSPIFPGVINGTPQNKHSSRQPECYHRFLLPLNLTHGMKCLLVSLAPVIHICLGLLAVP